MSYCFLKTILAIECQIGDLPIEALKNGVFEYYVNDISADHLKILLHKANLKLIIGKAPEVLKSIDKKFDAIIADKVIHFFSPAEIKEFLNIATSLLKHHGTLYITTASPYCEKYTGILEKYLARKAQGDDFPGYFTDMKSHFKAGNDHHQHYQLPDAMVLFDRTGLIQLINNHGMRVYNSYALKIPTADSSNWTPCADEESNVVGAVAILENG